MKDHFTSRHIASRWLSKIILALLCLTVLTEQSNYRFYQLSTRDVSTSRQQTETAPARLTVIDITEQPPKSQFGSLDKRFEPPHFFLCQERNYSIVRPHEQQPTNNLLLSVNVVSGIDHIDCLRGPPSHRFTII